MMPLDCPRSTSQVTTSKCHLTSTCHHHHPKVGATITLCHHHPPVLPPPFAIHPEHTCATHVWEQPQ